MRRGIVNLNGFSNRFFKLFRGAIDQRAEFFFDAAVKTFDLASSLTFSARPELNSIPPQQVMIQFSDIIFLTYNTLLLYPKLTQKQVLINFY
jgi:hypothetical protein